MKIDRRSFLASSSTAVLLAKHQLSSGMVLQRPSTTPVTGRQVAVYTTADNTKHRLSPSGTFAFKPMGQPLETHICVFVDPAKAFQAALGIGAALTDAAAETFAKLPRPKQQELLN